MNRGPVLAAEDAEDLEIISARLQDAVARLKDLVWLPKSRRFAALFNRFKWEEAEKQGVALRVQARLSFEAVLSAKSQNIAYGGPDRILSLLAIRYTQKAPDDPAGTVDLMFSGGGTIRLEVECLEATLSDMSGEWAARGRPSHPLET
jgi:hypothetical protein